MSLLFLTDIINRIGIDPKEVKLIRHAYSHKLFKQYYEMGMIEEYTRHQKRDFPMDINIGWYSFLMVEV